MSGQWILFANWQEAAGMRELEEEKKKVVKYARGSLLAWTKLLCAPCFQRSLERGVKPLLSWAFKAHSLKSLSEQLLVITPEFVCVILSHWKYFLDWMNKGKHGLDKLDLQKETSLWAPLTSPLRLQPCASLWTLGSSQQVFLIYPKLDTAKANPCCLSHLSSQLSNMGWDVKPQILEQWSFFLMWLRIIENTHIWGSFFFFFISPLL